MIENDAPTERPPRDFKIAGRIAFIIVYGCFVSVPVWVLTDSAVQYVFILCWITICHFLTWQFFDFVYQWLKNFVKDENKN